VASKTLTNPHWTGTTVLAGDIAAAIRELKAKSGRDLQVQGSGARKMAVFADPNCGYYGYLLYQGNFRSRLF